MATYTPRRVRDEEERSQYSSEYIQLDKGEKFIGYALFQGDPKESEPGYFEYWEHYDPGLGKRGQSVPCAGDDCPYCEDGDKPRNRSKSAWLVIQIGDKKLKTPEFRTFTMGPQIIRQVSELRQEGDKIKGRLFRVSRPEEREYVVAPKTETMKVADVKEALKACPDFEKGVTNTLKRAMERTLMSRALSDDEPDEAPRARRDDDDEPTPAKGKASKGKTKDEEPEEETPAEWPDSLEDEEVTVSEVDGDGNYFEAASDSYEGTKNVYTTEGIEFDLSELAEGQVVTISATQDSDGDYILDAEPTVEEAEPEAAADPEEAGADLPDKIEDEVFAVTGIDAENDTMEVENDELGLAFTLYFLDKGPGSDTDLDDYSVGDKIKVTAEKDTEGDMVATAVPDKVTAKGGAKKKTAAAAGGKKGGKGK